MKVVSSMEKPNLEESNPVLSYASRTPPKRLPDLT
jgi:hypothetical protein